MDLLASSTMSFNSSSLIVSPSSNAIRLRFSKVITPVLSVSNKLKALSISASDSFSFWQVEETQSVGATHKQCATGWLVGLPFWPS